MANTDARTGITSEQMRHVVAGVHIGRMGILAPRAVQSVLSLSLQPGMVPEGTHHRHLPVAYQVIDRAAIDAAAAWTLSQVWSQRTILIRSEAGRQRPGLVAAMVILGLGGRYADAMSLVQGADPEAMSDVRFQEILRAEDAAIRARTQA